jgi:hypothetical protein
MLPIGQFSRFVRISIRMLRHYAAAHRNPPGSIIEIHRAEIARRDLASLAS